MLILYTYNDFWNFCILHLFAIGFCCDKGTDLLILFEVLQRCIITQSDYDWMDNLETTCMNSLEGRVMLFLGDTVFTLNIRAQLFEASLA